MSENIQKTVPTTRDAPSVDDKNLVGFLGGLIIRLRHKDKPEKTLCLIK
ncbi:MAG: hypothetical protein LBP58_09755 [Azoarcus sp.]|jgi:hypothetical protein|nr:hypothetical protein [Azoarcus sp.]